MTTITPALSKQQPIEDVQNTPDMRCIPIDKVGIKNINHPIKIRGMDKKEQHTVANFNMYVNLPHDFKGTHMSRFIEILNNHDDEITIETFKIMLHEMTTKLEAKEGHIEMAFPYFINKEAPISKVKSLLDYQITFIGEINENAIYIDIKVLVPVTSLCPCSKKISDYGAHNQRSHITIQVKTQEFIWIEEIIDIAEKQASCELYGILKRPDEKHVTERAYDNPKFVEDLVRDIAVELNKDTRILKYTVESENFESIHNHSAYAFIEKDNR